MASREDMKKLIDVLPDAEFGSLVDFAQFLQLKVSRRSFVGTIAALNAAPPDEELYTTEDREEARLAREEYSREGGVSLEALRAELGL